TPKSRHLQCTSACLLRANGGHCASLTDHVLDGAFGHPSFQLPIHQRPVEELGCSYVANRSCQLFSCPVPRRVTELTPSCTTVSTAPTWSTSMVVTAVTVTPSSKRR